MNLELESEGQQNVFKLDFPVFFYCQWEGLSKMLRKSLKRMEQSGMNLKGMTVGGRCIREAVSIRNECSVHNPNAAFETFSTRSGWKSSCGMY